MLPFKSPAFFPAPRTTTTIYIMAINLVIVIMSYSSVALGRSVVSFLAAICFFSFLWLYNVRDAIDRNTRCSYTRLYPVQQTDLQLS